MTEFTSEELSLAARVAKERGYANMAQDLEEHIEIEALSAVDKTLYYEIKNHLLNTTEYETYHNRTVGLINLIKDVGWSKDESVYEWRVGTQWHKWENVPRNVLVKDVDGDFWWNYNGTSYFASRENATSLLVSEYDSSDWRSGATYPDTYAPFTFVRTMNIKQS